MTNQEITFQSTNEDLTTDERHIGQVLVPLFKGVVYQDTDPARWDSLVTLQPLIRDHVSLLGLELLLDEAEGWAFLRTRLIEDDQEELPRLMTRRALSFPVSLLVALLRKRLVEFDVAGGETRLVLSRDEVVDMVRLFMPDTSNEAKLIDQVDTHINKVIELGFLRKMKSTEASGSGKLAHYEVKRIIRAFVDAQWLSELDNKLAEYSAVLSGDPLPLTTTTDISASAAESSDASGPIRSIDDEPVAPKTNELPF